MDLNRLRARRKSLGYTQEDMAKAIGKESATYQRYENGVIKGISVDTLQLIADKLECSPLYLMGLSDVIDPINNKRRSMEEACEILMSKLSAENLAQALNYLEFLASRKDEAGSKKDR